MKIKYGFYVFLFFLIFSFPFISIKASTEIDSDILVDTNWILENSPYIVSIPLYIPIDTTLTIDAGVVVKFLPDSGFLVDGALVAEGTAGEPIYFTSFTDDSVGGDSNEDMDFSTPWQGDWDDVFIKSSTSPSVFKNVIERYSSGGFFLSDAVNVSFLNLDTDSDISIMNSTASFDGLRSQSLQVLNDSHVSVENFNILSEYNSVVLVHDGSSLSLKSGSIDSSYGNTIVAYENSSISLDTVEVFGNTWRSGALTIYNDSSGNILNSNFSNTKDGVTIFNDSSLVMKDFSISCENDGLVGFNDTTFQVDGGYISCFQTGVTLFNNTNTEIKNIKVSDALDSGFLVFSNNSASNISVTKSEITNNENGFMIYGSLFSAFSNNIHDNVNGVVTFPMRDRNTDEFIYIDLDFKNNFWGDMSGPFHETINPNGLGNNISDNVLVSPWLFSNPLIQTRNPVILIPGILGTQLLKDFGDKEEIWPNLKELILSINDNFLEDLSLESDGSENILFPMKVGNILKKIATTDVFDGLISKLEEGGYKEGVDLFIFPYDWRKDISDSSSLLEGKIDAVLSDTHSEKVDIVSHSMGGLVAKKYIKDNGSTKIDKLIFVGTPHLGAPKAFKALMYGDDMGVNTFFGKVSVLNPNTIKKITQNMPSVFALLPSEKYIDGNESFFGMKYVVDSIDLKKDLDFLDTKNFLIKNNKNIELMSSAESLHSDIDDLDMSPIKMSNFSGCGTKTIGKIIVKQKSLFKKDYKIEYINGDFTVPLHSSVLPIENKYFVKNFVHSDLPSANGVKEDIFAILNDKDIPESVNVSKNIDDCFVSGKVVSVHSPVSMDIYDIDGNHTGYLENGDFEYGIPSVSYDEIEGEKFAFLPDGIDYKILNHAQGLGSYDFYVEEVNKGDDIIKESFWGNIPLQNLESNSEMSINKDASNFVLKVDTDGDGKFEKSTPPVADYSKEIEKKKQFGYFSKNNILPEIIKVKEKEKNIKENISKDVKIKKGDSIIKDIEKYEKKKVKSVLQANVIQSDIEFGFWNSFINFFKKIFRIK